MIKAPDSNPVRHLNYRSPAHAKDSQGFLKGIGGIVFWKMLQNTVRKDFVERAFAERKETCIAYDEFRRNPELRTDPLRRKYGSQGWIYSHHAISPSASCYTPSTPVAAYIQQRFVSRRFQSDFRDWVGYDLSNEVPVHDAVCGTNEEPRRGIHVSQRFAQLLAQRLFLGLVQTERLDTPRIGGAFSTHMPPRYLKRFASNSEGLSLVLQQQHRHSLINWILVTMSTNEN
jgi:hypothetical protein